jgi:hypothetical protein
MLSAEPPSPRIDSGLEIEDRIDLVEVDRRLLAVNTDRGRVSQVDLRSTERVISLRSGGIVGVASTDQRLLGVTTRSSGFQEVDLRLTERGFKTLHVSDRLALVPLETRLLGLTAGSSVWTELGLLPGEIPVRVAIESEVGLCVTPRRAIALSGRGGGFVETSLTPKEEIEEASLEERSITLRTTYRVLVYQSGSDRWTEIRRTGFRKPPRE